MQSIYILVLTFLRPIIALPLSLNVSSPPGVIPLCIVQMNNFQNLNSPDASLRYRAITLKQWPRRLATRIRSRTIHFFFVLFVLFCGNSSLALAVPNPSPSDKAFDELYTKYEYRIPMRDGVKLFTIVFTPKDTSTNYPILLQRTPYNLKPYTIDVGRKPGDFPNSFVKEQFIFAQQDVRGRFASEGTFVDERPQRTSHAGPNDTDESTDAYDTIEWLVKNIPGNNGNVGLQGISYLGFYAAAGMIDSHPALKAVSPQAPSVDLFDGDDILHGGGFWLVHNFDFFAFFGEKLDDPLHQSPRGFDFRTPDGYRFFLEAGSLAQL